MRAQWSIGIDKMEKKFDRTLNILFIILDIRKDRLFDTR